MTAKAMKNRHPQCRPSRIPMQEQQGGRRITLVEREGSIIMRYLIVALSLITVSLALARPPANWCATPLAKWSEAPTVDSCTEAIPPDGMPAVIPADHRMQLPVPQPPFGKWEEAGGALQATGLTNCWSTMLLPTAQENAAITTRFTVTKSCGAARQLPGGCVRWGFHWGENLPGWDVGVVLGYQNPLNFYRVQLSAARGELALWDATGGFLQLIPCAVEMGKPHELSILWLGAHITAKLDGKEVMDYWDQTLPYVKGQVGLAVWKSEVRVDQFAAAVLAKHAPEKMPAHKANFRFEPTKNILTEHPGFHMTPRDGVILFDGYEPISYFYKQELDKGVELSRGSLLQEAVKLKPGWRAAYSNYMGPPCNDGSCPVLQGEMPDALHVTSLGEVMTFTYTGLWKNALQTAFTCTVRYDGQRGVYRYEYQGTAKAIAPCTFNEFEFYDPYVYNNREPGPEVAHTWNPAGHKWWVYQNPEGAWERFPLIDPLAHDATEVKWGKFSDFLYPDPGACPMFENDVEWAKPQGRLYSLGQCNWGYDYHHREVGARLALNPGDTRAFNYTLTALPPKEADALFAQAKLKKEVAEEKAVLIPFIPNGDKFDLTTTWQDPKYQMFWEGSGARDETVGHGDKFSLRLDAPGVEKFTLRQYMIEAYAKRWWVRGWVKTKGVKEAGARLTLAYPGYAKDVFSLGGGDQDWSYFSFTTDVFKVRDETQFTIDLPGGGSLWLDDFAVSALKDGEEPKVTGTAMK